MKVRVLSSAQSKEELLNSNSFFLHLLQHLLTIPVSVTVIEPLHLQRIIAPELEMKRRFRIYGFGVLLGLVMAWGLFLRGRNTKNYTSWTPNNRILEEIRLDSTLETSDWFWCEMKCLGFSSIEYEALINDGNVNFNNGQVKTWPRTYEVEYETEDKGTLVIVFSKTETKHFSVLAVKKQGEKVNCDC